MYDTDEKCHNIRKEMLKQFLEDKKHYTTLFKNDLIALKQVEHSLKCTSTAIVGCEYWFKSPYMAYILADISRRPVIVLDNNSVKASMMFLPTLETVSDLSEPIVMTYVGDIHYMGRISKYNFIMCPPLLISTLMQ